ncbi:MAG TPA: 50S ribosomal protein L17 [Thermoanaerobaculia bacterium]|nr:50S ribosomal protein L17 [Thermoanaerobaculia bacterium]
MRHAVRGRKLGRTSSHREALFRNQLQSLMESERIITTLPKAKELRPIAEKVITRGKHGTVHDRRWALRWLIKRELVKKLFDEIAPRFTERPGGYLRIVKLGPRQGDGAEMAIIELVERESVAAPAEAPKETKAKKEPKSAKEKKPAKEKAAKEKPAKEAKPKKAAGDKKPAKKEGTEKTKKGSQQKGITRQKQG